METDEILLSSQHRTNRITASKSGNICMGSCIRHREYSISL